MAINKGRDMLMNTRVIKNAIREVLAEESEAGIQPIVIPPLAVKLNQVDSTVPTNDVVERLLRHNRYKRVESGTIDTYEKHFSRFAR